MKKNFLLFFLFIIGFAYGQAPYFQSYYLLRKNEPVQINTVFQDRTGFIWLGTNKGLFKYDGIGSKRFTKSDSLPDENVTAIAQDSLGRIWTGHKNGELAIIDNESIKKFSPSEGSAAESISDILFDNDGNLWFSTLNDGLYYFIDDRLFRLDDTDGMPDLFIYDIAQDNEGRIWAGTDGGAVICELKNKKASLKVISYKQGLPDNIIKKIVFGNDGSVWLGTEDAGVIKYDPTSGQSKTLASEEWKYGTVTDFVIDGSQFWISTLKGGLVVYNQQTKKSKVLNQNDKDNTRFVSINKLLKDREGNIWIGSKTGLSRTYGDYIEYLNTLEPAQDKNIVALTVDKEGNIWFSNSYGLYKRALKEDGNASVEKQLTGTAFQKYTVISLYTDAQGYIWAGLYGEGILRIHPRSGKITYLNKELRNGNILSITGKGNIVWLATLGGATRIKIEGEKLDVTNYGSEEGLISDYIYQVFIDSRDQIWLATDGKGVDRFDGRMFHHYSDGLNSKVIYGFAEDNDHNIWVNAQADGLYELTDTGFNPIAKEVRLRDRNISSLSSDAEGNLVIAHDFLIYIYNQKNNKIHYLGEELGLNEHKPNLNAISKDLQGRLFIGTDNGIVIYSAPESGMMNSPTPDIYSLKIFNKLVPIASDLEFDYNQNNMTINYLGFWYQNPNDLIFQYKMEDYDLDWISTRDHFAIYSSLPPGDYIFKLRASATGDFKEAKEATLHFIVNPPFWRTMAFYLFVILVIVASGYSYIKYRERKLISDNQVLEGKVEERTQEIQKKNEEILAQAEEIKSMNDNLEELVEERTSELEIKNKALEEYAFITAHNLRAPVASILGLIHLALKLELKEEEKEILIHLKDSADKLDAIVRSITEAIEKGDS
jgi:ligand-binding sensor domain-containing protein